MSRREALLTHPLVKAARDPVGSARMAKRLAAFVGLTTTHLRRVPDEVEQVHMNILANEWARVLLDGMGLALHKEGEAAGNPGALLISNHRSYIDIIALLAATPCCFLAKGDVADWPVLGRAAVRAGTIFVDRKAKNSREEARRIMRELLEAGHTVVVFPEGTTYRGPGCEEFRIGSFEVACEAGVPILPVALEYADPDDAWGDESFLEHFTERFRQPAVNVHVHFGPAIHGLEPLDAMHATHDWISTRLNHLWREILRHR